MRLNFLSPPPLPSTLPLDLQAEINKLKNCADQGEVLHRAYNLLTAKYRGYRIRTVTRIMDLFHAEVGEVWSKTGYLHCTNMNYLMKIMLVGSGWFKEEDIVFRWTILHLLSPHEYLRVKSGNQQINVDLWASVYGIKYGDYAHGFHIGKLWA